MHVLLQRQRLPFDHEKARPPVNDTVGLGSSWPGKTMKRAPSARTCFYSAGLISSESAHSELLHSQMNKLAPVSFRSPVSSAMRSFTSRKMS
jgi:hypothetical protein